MLIKLNFMYICISKFSNCLIIPFLSFLINNKNFDEQKLYFMIVRCNIFNYRNVRYICIWLLFVLIILMIE